MSKIQTIPEYQELASRTCPDLGKIDNERHMNLGVITEIAECLDVFKKYMAYKKPMDLVNVGEELADATWYVCNKSRFQNIPLDDLDGAYADIKNFIETKMFLKPGLTQEVKTEAILIIILGMYCSESNSIYRAPIIQIACFKIIAEWYGLDFFQCLTNNIEKLKVRYPEKFSNEAAQNRNLEAEREKLEVTGTEEEGISEATAISDEAGNSVSSEEES